MGITKYTMQWLTVDMREINNMRDDDISQIYQWQINERNS